MIVAIPYFPGYTNYSKLTESINTHGLCEGHNLLVISRRVDEEEAMSFEEEISGNFARSAHKVIDPPRERGPHALPNEMFRQSLWYLKNYEPQPGEVSEVTLLYFDPTLRLAKKGWADAIQSEYFARGGPQVLACQATRADGHKISRGAVLFNKTYVAESALLAHLPGSTHWREYLVHEINHCLTVSETLLPRGKKSVVNQAPPGAGRKKVETPA